MGKVKQLKTKKKKTLYTFTVIVQYVFAAGAGKMEKTLNVPAQSGEALLVNVAALALNFIKGMHPNLFATSVSVLSAGVGEDVHVDSKA